jgi:hypothetical protein
VRVGVSDDIQCEDTPSPWTEIKLCSIAESKRCRKASSVGAVAGSGRIAFTNDFAYLVFRLSKRVGITIKKWALFSCCLVDDSPIETC